MLAAHAATLKAAEAHASVEETRDCIRGIIDSEPPGGFVARILGREVDP